MIDARREATRGPHPELLYPDPGAVPRAGGTPVPAPGSARLLELLRSDQARIADLAGRELAVRVPDCPDWTVADLLRHLGSVSNRVLACLSGGRLVDVWETAPPAGGTLPEWYADRSGRLVAALADRDPAEPWFGWWPPDQTIGFWYRRMAHEFAVHRVDLESALDAGTPVDPDLALDGCDEVLERWLTYFGVGWALAGNGERVAVRAGAASWLVTLNPSGPTVTRGSTDADATVAGGPSDVYLWLWGRLSTAAVAATSGEPVQRLRTMLDRTTT